MMYREDKVRHIRIHQLLGDDVFIPEGLLFDRLPVYETRNDGHLLINLMEMLIDDPLLVPVVRQAQEHVFKARIDSRVL